MKIIQITDTHFYAEADGRLAGVNTRASYQDVKNMALSRHADATVIVHTGDICQNPDRKAYQWFMQDMASHAIPVYCLPGNHDDPTLMRHVLGNDQVFYKDCLDTGAWRFIFLSSVDYGTAAGRLSAASMARMQTLIEDAPCPFVMVCLHHNPLPMGSQWLDTMTVDKGETFMRTLQMHPQVRLVVHGHVHQASDRTVEGIRLLSTPSTCFQFRPGSDEFSLDSRTPGYRWFELHDNGNVETGVERLPALPAGFEQTTAGY